MGIFMGFALILLTMIYQDAVYEESITEPISMINTNTQEVYDLFNDLNLLTVDNVRERKVIGDFFTKNCKENYVDILRCQKRHTESKGTINNLGQNPPKEFCNAFYKHIEYRKGIEGRLSINELKHLLLQATSMKPDIGMDTVLFTDNNFINRVKYMSDEPKYNNYDIRELNTFTESPDIMVAGVIDNIESAKVFLEEYKELNLKKYVNFFEVNNTDHIDDEVIKNELTTPYSTTIRLHSTNSLLNNKVVNYYYVGEETETRALGIKLFINKYFITIRKYREKLLKLKRVIPEVDMMLSKEYNGKVDIIDVPNNFYSIYKKYYEKYRILLDALEINDEDLFVSGNVIEIKELIDYYDNDKISYFDNIKDLGDNEVDELLFSYRLVDFKTPYTSSDLISQEDIDIINNSAICDLKKYVKKIKY